MTQNIEQRTEVAVTKYENAANKVEEFAESDSLIATTSGSRKSFPKLSREIEEAGLESLRLGAANHQGNYAAGVTYDKPNWTYTYNGQQWGLSKDFDLSALPYKSNQADPNNDSNLAVRGEASQSFVQEKSSEYSNIAKAGAGLDADALFTPGVYSSIDGSILNTPNGRRGVVTVSELEGRFQQTFMSDNGGFYSRMTTSLVYDPWVPIYGEEIAFDSISAVAPIAGTNVTLTDKQRSDAGKAIISLASAVTGPAVDVPGEIESQPNGTVASLDVPFSASTETNREDKLNLHFGTMHGNPFRQTDQGGTVNYTVTDSQVSGSYQIPLASTAGLDVDQTVVYLCSDNTYKTNVIKSISVNTITLKKPLQKAVNAGENLWNFWDDRAHPNPIGYYAIADDAIEELRYTGVVQETILPASLSPYTSSDTITLENDDDPEAPGCVDVQYARVTASVGGGAISEPLKLTSGMYKVTGVLNPSVNSDINELLVGISQRRPREDNLTPVTQLVANAKFSVQDCLTHFEITFYAQDLHYTYLYFESDTAGVFEVGKCEFVKVTDNIFTLNCGKHVLYGDSWIARGHIFDRLVERLPNATFIKKGNSGWASNQLYADFDNQVTPEKPDTVWLMCSTNDFFRNYSVDKFSFEMGRIKQKIFEIGANCIGWDATVGSNDDPDTQYSHNLTRSRQYALVTSYRRSNVQYDYFPVRKVRDTLNFNETIPANTEVFVGCLASVQSDVDIVYSAFENKGGAVVVKGGFRSSVAIPTVNTETWTEIELKRPRDGLKLVFDGSTRIPTFSLENKTASALTVRGTIIAEYYPQR